MKITEESDLLLTYQMHNFPTFLKVRFAYPGSSNKKDRSLRVDLVPGCQPCRRQYSVSAETISLLSMPSWFLPPMCCNITLPSDETAHVRWRNPGRDPRPFGHAPKVELEGVLSSLQYLKGALVLWLQRPPRRVYSNENL